MIVYECDGKRAIKHRTSMARARGGRTGCGIDLYDKRTGHFTAWAMRHIHTEHELSKEVTCSACFPRRRR